MSKLKSGLIQMSLKGSTEDTPEKIRDAMLEAHLPLICLLYTSPSPRDGLLSRMPSSA